MSRKYHSYVIIVGSEFGIWIYRNFLRGSFCPTEVFCTWSGLWIWVSSFSTRPHPSALYHVGVPQHFYSGAGNLCFFPRLLWTFCHFSVTKIFTVIVLTNIHATKSKIHVPSTVISQEFQTCMSYCLLTRAGILHQHHKLNKSDFEFVTCPLCHFQPCSLIYSTPIPGHSSKELGDCAWCILSLLSLVSHHLI